MTHEEKAREIANGCFFDGVYDGPLLMRAIAQALREAERAVMENAAGTCLGTVWCDGIRFSAGYKNGWIDATEECAKRIRAAAEKERGK